MGLPPIVALEIGTSRTVALVGDMDDNERVSITGMGFYPSTGVRKGEVINIENARVGVSEAVRQAENSADVVIREVLLGISGGHVKVMRHRGAVPVRGRGRVVAREDVEELMELANSVNLPESRAVLHTVCQSFSLDDQTNIMRPEGMQGAQLAVDVLVVHAVRNRLDNTVNTVRGIPLVVSDVGFMGLCSSLAVLTPEQKRSGVVVIDLGGGTTDYLAYAGDVPVTAGSLALGGDHLTNDVALAFNIPIARAEELKRREGFAHVEAGASGRRLTLPGEVGFAERSVSVRSLQTVLNARAEEILRCVRADLDAAGVLPHIGAGVVLTGGGAYLRQLPTLAERIFGLPCSVGKPINVEGLGGVEQPAAFAAAAGLVLYGFKTYRENSLLAPIKNWLKGVFGR